MSNTPLPEPDWLHLKSFGYAPGNYMNRCRWCDKTVTDVDKLARCCRPCAEKLHAHAAAVSAAKDAEIAGLQIKADLFDLAMRKGIITVHSERIHERDPGTRCSWLDGHTKACDISNDAARAALGDKTPNA